MHQMIDPSTLDLTNPDNYVVDEDSVLYNKDGKTLTCVGSVECVQWFEDAIKE